MEQDRRQFYRIDKWVALEFQLLEGSSEILDSPNPGMFKVSPYFMLHAELEELNSIIEEKFERLSTLSPDTAETLKLLNQKIDRITQSLSENEQQGFNLLTDKVNLSEGGLSFNLEKALPLGQKVLIRLILPESNLGLRLMAEVKRCIEKNDQHEIGLEFQRMPEACRTKLAHLIFRSQIDQKQK